MAFEPNNITKEHIQKAVARIKSEHINLVPSTRWNVLVDDEQFPPKDLMRLAHEEMNGERIWLNSGGYATNRYFEKMGYAIVEKDNLADPIKELIAKYKTDLQENELADEIYKWKLVNQYKGRPDLTAPNFLEELKSINYSNLIYGVGLAVVYHLAKDRTEPYRECFKVLFNESLPLSERLAFFNTETLKLYRELVPEDKYSHHQDERTMATFLAFYNPDKYPFYKDSFYQKYCKLIGVKARKKGEKYMHYLELLNEFIAEYIEPDTELLNMVDYLLPEDAFKDTNRKILAQDILYRMLDKGLEEIEIGDASVFKISMGDFTDQDIENCISDRKILVHQSTRPIGRSSESQATVFARKLCIGDYFYLTPGNRGMAVSLLGRVTSDAVPASYKDLGSDGWLERSFELVSVPKNKTKYKGAQKWWTPNSNSTCVLIKDQEIDEANKQLFEPYFMAKLVQAPVVSGGDIDVYEEKATSESNSAKTDVPLNVILYGPPGTGKTYNTINKALEILGVKTEGVNRKILKNIYDTKVAEGQVIFTTFHQSMSYEDFIEGIKPETIDERIVYEIKPGTFKQICTAAQTPNQLDFNKTYERLKNDLAENGGELLDLKTPTGKSFSVTLNSNNNLSLHTGPNKEKQGVLTKENIQKQIQGEKKYLGWEGYFSGVINHLKEKYNYNPKPLATSQNFVLIIDEINRGNVSQIFGELITLIEEDKRLGKDEQLEVTLPYSKEKFGVPDNLYIIGTMNTADRSVEALDTALRRRFSFVEMSPRYDLEGLQKEVEGYKLADILKRINRRIEKLLGKDNLIGHSYFLCVDNAEDLRAAFQNKIIPLLQEYFYGDYGKIGLMLGEGFFLEIDEDEEEDIFATFGNYDPAGLAQKEVYHLAELTSTNRLTDTAFREALDKLMK